MKEGTKYYLVFVREKGAEDWGFFGMFFDEDKIEQRWEEVRSGFDEMMVQSHIFNLNLVKQPEAQTGDVVQ